VAPAVRSGHLLGSPGEENYAPADALRRSRKDSLLDVQQPLSAGMLEWHWLLSLAGAQGKIEAWQNDYNAGPPLPPAVRPLKSRTRPGEPVSSSDGFLRSTRRMIELWGRSFRRQGCEVEVGVHGCQGGMAG